MKIIDVHKFNTKLKLLTEWNNFKHRIAKYVSEIIKKLSEKIKNDDDNLKNDTVMISIQKYFLKHRLKNKNIRLKIYFNLDGINFPIYFIMENNNFNERISGSCNYNKNTKLPKSIDIIIPYKNNYEKFKNFIHGNFILELKEVINHELTHLFDKESIIDDYLNPLESEIKTFTENLFYQLQFSEIKAVLQESMPRVKNGEDIIDILSNRIKSIFYPKYENLKSSLVKLYFYVFISTTYNNINLKKYILEIFF